MSLMCAYQNCLCTKYPCGSTAFFRLPSDDRRSTWIKNSGNKALFNIGDKSNRFFCENHFRECDIRTQFNRKILRKHAVPIEFEPSQPKPKKPRVTVCRELDEDENCESNLLIEKFIIEGNSSQLVKDIMVIPTFEIQHNDNRSEEHYEDTYNIKDYHLSTENCVLTSQQDDATSKEEIENNFVEVDSSTIDIQIDLDESSFTDDPDIESTQKEVQELEQKPDESVEMTTSNNDYEEDKHFALSLVGYFQRLPKNRKVLAKLKILQYLTELNIG